MTRLLRNFALLMSADILARVLSFALVIYVSRAMGPTALGELSFAQAMVTYFGVFADLGLTTLAIREIAQRPADSERIAVTATVAQLGFAIVLQAILGGLVLVLPVSGATRLLTFVYGFTMAAQALSLIYVLQAHERMAAVAGLRILVQAGSVGLGIALLIATRQLLFVPITAVAVTLYADVLAAVLLGRRRQLRWVRPEPGLARWLVGSGVIFVVTGITVQVLYNFSSLVIGLERGERELGIYSAAWKLTLIMLGVGAILMSAIFPNLSRLASNRSALESFFRKLAGVVGYISLPMAVGVMVLAPDLISVVYGRTYARSALVLAILAVVPAVGLYNMLVAHTLVAIGRQLSQMWTGLIASAVAIVAALLLTPLLGIVGGAVAGAVAELVGFVLFIRMAARHLHVVALREFAVNLSIAFPLAAAVLLTRQFLHLRSIYEILIALGSFAILSLVFRPGPVADVLRAVVESRLAAATLDRE